MKLKRYRFLSVSYSPATEIIAEYPTEAFTVASFPGQPTEIIGLSSI